STKPEAALARGQGWQPWQEGGWTLAPRDRGPEVGMYCWMGRLDDFSGLVPDGALRLGRVRVRKHLQDPQLAADSILVQTRQASAHHLRRAPVAERARGPESKEGPGVGARGIHRAEP